MNEARWVTPDLQSLVDLFYENPADLGVFNERAADLIPAEYRSLLAHDAHMTVTLEAHHNSSVSVEVLDFQRKTLESASAVLTISRGISETMEGYLHRKVQSLPNGFDASKLSDESTSSD